MVTLLNSLAGYFVALKLNAASMLSAMKSTLRRNMRPKRSQYCVRFDTY